ncbi:hypothetical protein CSUB01_12615 [Colletotrichum sublineola]|uniref:Uncharacterized protein n=1 Tax=Colletotrichum sublineola TaxID=1173701 RepID=A0A066XY21_COLSU|nr:hypothetical protein CSUB01_12615 [Colletotrichum sublineola]
MKQEDDPDAPSDSSEGL